MNQPKVDESTRVTDSLKQLRKT